MKNKAEPLLRKQDWHYENAGSDWRDGLLLGNGNFSLMAYEPSHLKWVINKVDVFDTTISALRLKRWQEIVWATGPDRNPCLVPSGLV